MRFSIIIPVYNVERYIDRCLNTVMHQTFDDYEVIVVDDESPDGSMDIVRRYAEEFPGKIRMLHQKNTRQGGARNNGVSHARGEYILFVDSDDYVALNMLEVVDARLRQNACDILVFSHHTVSEIGDVLSEHENRLPEGVYHPMENRELVLYLLGAPWEKAFSRSFYLESGFRFPEKLMYEDIMTRLLYAKANTVVLCDEKLYYYVIRDNSSIRQKLSEKMLDVLSVARMTEEAFKAHGLHQAFWEPLECALIYGILHILDRINNAEPDNPMQHQMADYIAEHFPDYKENAYVSRELAKSLDCLLRHDFRRYHYRFLVWNRMKERVLQNPLLDQLNKWRKNRK